jgi:hypothetical protein
MMTVEQTSADAHLGVPPMQPAGAQHTEADHIAIGATMAQGIQNDIDEPANAAAVGKVGGYIRAAPSQLTWPCHAVFEAYKKRPGYTGSDVKAYAAKQLGHAEKLALEKQVAEMAQELKEARKLVAAQPQHAGAACLDTPAFALLNAYTSKAPCTAEMFAALDSVKKDVIASVNELAKTCQGNLDYVRRFFYTI